MSPILKSIYIIGFLLCLSLIFLGTGASGIFSLKSCLDFENGLKVCAASDMAKITKTGKIPLEDPAFDLSKGRLVLNAARNETIAFQLLLKSNNSNAPKEVKISFDDLQGSDHQAIKADKNIRLFKAHYHRVEHGGYTWGPKSEVLGWPDDYPDALIPQSMECTNQLYKREKISISEAFPVSENKKENQSVWVDIYIPEDQPAGEYKTQIKILAEDTINTIPLTMKIWDLTLPDKNSIDAVGELYSSYEQEGVGKDLSSAAWQQMAHCYQQMAHKHRMVFIERLSVKPDQPWEAYNKVYASILNGQLFNHDSGYIGPGKNTPVSIWRTPWPEGFIAKVKQVPTDQQINNYELLAKKWQQNVEQNHWDKTDYFAYIFDEVDGATDQDELGDVDKNYIAMAHKQMDRVQKAIDKGTGNLSVDLIWTSHADPQVWQGVPDEDLKDIIRFWSPNASSANTTYLSDRKKEGDRVWFYHSGHPAVGIHSINASGIEMRSWGVITARYNFDGHFMWALNYGDKKKPYHYPSYKKEDDRFGNGMMIYPGNKLATIGLKSTPGPVPSMRLKVWRRGLQDAELILLARKAGYEKEVDQMLKKLIPTALSEGKGSASWSDDPQDWIKFRQRLLELASSKKL